MIINVIFYLLFSFNQNAYSFNINHLSDSDSLRFENEVHLKNIKQLTFGGDNAEAYFSFDNNLLVFQSNFKNLTDVGCDQIFLMNSNGTNLTFSNKYKIISKNKGRTTCSYFLPDGRIIYASTHGVSDKCPETKMFMNDRYVWPILDSYDIFITDKNYENTEVIIGGNGYDAEATVSPDGRFIIFTSTRGGDLDLWRYELETGETKQITNELGYDGGAFFSNNSEMIVWRASRPEGDDADIYQSLLNEGYVEPKELNIFISDINGDNVKQITFLEGANWAPFFHPSDKKIIFTSNHHSLNDGGRLFDLFLVDIDSGKIEQVTYSGTFDAFPMFSFDGKKLVFASNRRADRKESRDTNIFIADWVD